MGHRYQENDILTATPELLVGKLFETAIRSTRLAQGLAESSGLAERRRSLSKALAIVGELRASLDLERGGEIAVNLDRLYGFVIDRLAEASLHRRDEPVEEALRVLEPLGGAWQEVASTASAAPQRRSA